MRKDSERQNVERQRPLRVLVSAVDREEIEARAAAASLSVSAYLRAAGLGRTIRSTARDQHATIKELAKVNANQDRLAGLLKLWLAERPGQGAAARDVRAMLDRIGELQGKLSDIAGRA